MIHQGARLRPLIPLITATQPATVRFVGMLGQQRWASRLPSYLARAVREANDETPARARGGPRRLAVETQWLLGESRQLERETSTNIERDAHFTHDDWALHRSRWRKVRHLFGLFGSSSLQRLIFPDLAMVLGASSTVVWLNTHVYAAAPFEAPPLPFMVTATALSLLLAFRTNYSNHRFEEARDAWQTIVSSVRSLVRISCIHIAPTHPEAHAALTGLARAFPRCMVFSVCPDGDLLYPDGDLSAVQAQAAAEQQHQLRDVLPLYPTAVKKIVAAKDPPLEVAWMLSEVVAAIESRVPDRVASQLDGIVMKLEEAHSVTERVLTTPIPTNYTRHTSRFLCCFTTALPLALWPGCGIYTIPVSLGISFALLAIEDTGVVIEEPFDLLPVWSYVDQCDEAAKDAAVAAIAARTAAKAEKDRLDAMTAEQAGTGALNSQPPPPAL